MELRIIFCFMSFSDGSSCDKFFSRLSVKARRLGKYHIPLKREGGRTPRTRANGSRNLPEISSRLILLVTKTFFSASLLPNSRHWKFYRNFVRHR